MNQKELQIARQAWQRWQTHSGERELTVEKIRAGRGMEVESTDRIQKRMERLAAATFKERTTRVSAGGSPLASPSKTSLLIETIGFERVLGKSDFLGMDFLELALAVSRFVGRISIRTRPGKPVGFGTGFMVSPRLLLTNNHVLSSEQEAIYSEVEFDYQYDRFGRFLPIVLYGLEPQAFFMTNEALDFTLVAVRERSSSAGSIDLKQYGWSRLIPEQGKALIGDSLNIIQHPRGEAKQIVLRSNQLVDLPGNFAHYTADTEPGSSGSPVYNDQWEAVALHHSGVPRMQDGQYLAKDGSVWEPGMDPGELDWVANEGVRVSSLVEYIKKQHLSPAQDLLRGDMLTLEPPHPLESFKNAQPQPQVPPSIVVPDTGIHSQPTVATTSEGVTFSIPLQITVRLGTPATGNTNVTDPASNRAQVPETGKTAGSMMGSAAPGTNAPVPTTSTASPATGSAAGLLQPGLRESLTELERARQELYYDPEADRRAIEQYYAGIRFDQGNAEQLFDRLSQLLRNTHRTILTYNEARHRHLYPRVDLHEDGKLRSIYTSDAYDPETIIREDFTISESLLLRTRERLARLPNLSEKAMLEHLDLLEADAPYNTEHVVPQSWFDKRQPMRADLHHLFTCEEVCNSFRGNTPYAEFPSFAEAVREGCGIRESNRFEPAQGHGPVARATLYFLLRYPGEINANGKEYTRDRLGVLLDWHEKYPVSLYELHRNAAIQKSQGNRNVLIDFPQMARQIDFAKGLGTA